MTVKRHCASPRKVGSIPGLQSGDFHVHPHQPPDHLSRHHSRTLSREYAADRRPRQTDRARDRDHYRRAVAVKVSDRLLASAFAALRRIEGYVIVSADGMLA